MPLRSAWGSVFFCLFARFCFVVRNAVGAPDEPVVVVLMLMGVGAFFISVAVPWTKPLLLILLMLTLMMCW